MRRFSAALLVSSVLHAALLIYIGFYVPHTSPKKIKPIKISLIQKEKKPEPKVDEDVNKLIVEQPHANNERPKDPKYFSEQNNTVKEEMIKKKTSPTPPSSAPGESTPKEEQPRDLSKIPLIPDVGTLLKNLKPPSQGGNGGNGDGSSDYVPGVKNGEDILLNTAEFKYASFFNRVKRDIKQAWNPYPDWRREDPTGNLYGHIQKNTILSVVLDKDGFVKEVKVHKSSNIDFLDKNAINAFWDCKQFPNPPSGLVKNGRVEFLFGFNVDFKFTPGLKK